MLDISGFTEEQWQRLLDRLTHYALQKYRRLSWINGEQYRSPKGQGPEDIAIEAIKRLIEGKRQYDEHKYPDILVYLRGVVDSLISHIIESPEFEKKCPMPYIINSDGETEEIGIACKDPGPSKIYMQKEVVEKLKSILRAKFAEDQIVLGILECMEAGIDKRSEMAEYLEVNVTEITNAQKKLQRQFDKMRDETMQAGV